MSRMTKERRADLEKLADEDPHMCLLRELLNEIDALQQESALLLKEQVKLLREALLEITAIPANENSDPDRMADALWEIQGIVHRALEATKEGA